MKTKLTPELLAQAGELVAALPPLSSRMPTAEAGAEIDMEGVVGWDITLGGVRSALRRLPEDAPVTIRVNSPGGSAMEGFAIFNLLAQRRGPVTAVIDGFAASAASYIIMAAASIQMPTASMLMIHNSSLMTWGTKEDHEASAEFLGKIDAIMRAIYVARTGRAEDEIAAMMDAETWMTAEEAIAGGFADAIIEIQKQEESRALALSVDARRLVAGFKHAPGHIAAMARSTTPEAAPPKQEVDMTEKVKPGGDAAPVPARVLATTADLTKIATQAGLGVEWIASQTEATLPEAQAAALDAVAQAEKKRVTPSPVQITRDEGDTRRKALAAAMSCRARLVVSQAEQDMAGEMRGWSLNDFARAYVEMAGGRVSSAAAVTIAGAALGLRGPMASVGMHTTSDFPLLLANTASKSLRAAYDSSPRTFVPWCRQATMPDFKIVSRIALGGAPQLTQVNENGEIEMGTVGEFAESYRVFRFGRRIPITFEAIINDDLSGFTRVPGMFGGAAARLESDTVYGILNSNPNMADNVALFAAGHNNVGTGALAQASMGAGRSVMRKQTAPNGDILNLVPRHLIVPAELETAAESLMVQTVVPAQAGTTVFNPMARTTNVIAEPRLVSAVQWYFAADPDQIDTIEYAYLAGQETPQVTSYTDDATDGVVVKATHAFGAKAIDWRGLYRSSGS